MRSHDLKKIKLAPKQSYRIAFVILVFGIGIITAAYQYAVNTPRSVNLVVRRGIPTSLQIADTVAEQEKGLGGRISMSPNKGMLFVLGKQTKQCMWMKDMRFPLDIVWTNAAKKVVYLQQNLSPATYPAIYCPDVPAAYVLEVTAGSVQKLGVQNGQQLQF